MTKIQITEESGEHKKWYEIAKAKDMTLATLPEFLRHLSEDYQHDYGTICHAIAAAGLAAMRAMDRSPAGGITGFQAGCIMWEVIQRWMSLEGPLKLVQFENMLYPQYDHKFAKSISADTWKFLQDKARKLLAENGDAHSAVTAHWRSIADGTVPFGYSISEDS